MDIICKPKYNAIFWRNSEDEKWNQANLKELINDYEDEPVTIFNLWETVTGEKSGKFLYNVWECSACENLILTVDEYHGYQYCPHCGRMIVELF